ncbi:unnamed protein product [Rotaria sp. Silwood2]|nr:unnamed protein product [Rotaria sp. Silwood2]CAF3956446.1 unnamed protein product [Rotaria sp. Silwood2]
MAMYFAVLLFVLILVLQQTIHTDSFLSPIRRTNNNENRRLHTIRRLRAPLMGRSLLPTIQKNDDDDDDDFINDVSSTSNMNDDELPVVTKRRHGSVPLFGRRWILGKRRGPLYG